MKNLLETIDKMRNKNGCFTSELFQKMEQHIQEEIGKMDGENLPQEEKREKAKTNVLNKMLEQAIGVAVGVLIGALLGAYGPVSLILDFLQSIFPIRALLNVAARFFGGEAVKTGEKARGASTERGEKAAVEAGGAGAGVSGVIAEVNDAMINARAMAENIQQFVANVFNNKTTETEENKK